jgi:adenine-specific DNA-methyltransferase
METAIIPSAHARSATEDPVLVAHRLAVEYASHNHISYKKVNGQYFTSPQIAHYMASLCGVRGEHIRILDPGAGSGILSCAIAIELVNAKPRPRAISITAYETDAELAPLLAASYDALSHYLASKRVKLQTDIRSCDFVLDASRIPVIEGQYDAAIMNPPYFKIGKADPRALAMPMVCHGQPNIYSLFMALGAMLLKPSGELISISPRSFASGEYFKRFRQVFFDLVYPRTLHLLDSRQDAFKQDGVLQENLVARFVRYSERDRPAAVAVKSSEGIADVAATAATVLPFASVLDMSDEARVLRLPANAKQRLAIEIIERYGATLRERGFRVTTGRVVAFRCSQFMKQIAHGSEGAPLLWLQHIFSMQVQWPLERLSKPQGFAITQESMSLLIPDADYVLVRRFSAKEEARRVVAAPLAKGSLGNPWLAVENHINVIRLPDDCGIQSWHIARALAIYLNSPAVDEYVRALNGNTQIGAADLLSLPCPDATTLIALYKDDPQPPQRLSRRKCAKPGGTA